MKVSLFGLGRLNYGQSLNKQFLQAILKLVTKYFCHIKNNKIEVITRMFCAIGINSRKAIYYAHAYTMFNFILKAKIQPPFFL